MIQLVPMTSESFEKFKVESQAAYASSLAITEAISQSDARKYASEQFDKLIPNGTATTDQLFFDVIETKSNNPIGYLWLGFQTRFDRRIASINDIHISPNSRGNGFGKILMRFVEDEVRKGGAARVRLHVFHNNHIAKNLYAAMGFEPTNLDMRKDLF